MPGEPQGCLEYRKVTWGQRTTGSAGQGVWSIRRSDMHGGFGLQRYLVFINGTVGHAAYTIRVVITNQSALTGMMVL